MIVRWTPAALADVKSAFDFIDERSPKGARRVVGRVTAAIAKLADSPNVGRPGRRANLRELVVTGTPYIVMYEVGAADIVLVRVIHGAQQWPPEPDG